MKPQTLLFFSLLSVGGISPLEALAYTNQEFAQVINPQEARIDQFRMAEIQQLQLVLTRSAAQEKQPELLLRLAELYTEKYRLLFAKENDIWNKKIDAFLAMPIEKQKYARKPVLDSSQSKQWLTKAVGALEKIPLQKERFDRIDEVYYFLGFNRWELGKKKEGADAFETIIAKYPRSRYASEAYRYVADYAFASRDFHRSRDYYERAAKGANPVARPRILYGLAWSKYKLADYKGAMNTMKEAIVLGRDNQDAAKVGLALQRDAAESLALFFSEAGSVDEAAAFFNDLFPEGESIQILRKLASHYQEQGKYAKALAINKQLLSMGGAAAKEGEEQRFEIMVDSLNVSVTKGDRARQAALLKSMTTEFVVNASEPNAEKAEILRAQVRKAATLAHKEANKSGNPKAAYARAEELYRLYLQAFGPKAKPEDVAEIRFYLADVASQLGRHQEAANEYKALLDLSETNAAYKKYAKDSAAGMVFSLDNYFRGKGDAKDVSKSEADQLIGAIDTYVKQFPKDKDAPKYLARAAGILVTSDRMDEARPRLMELADKYSGSQEAWDAAANLLKDAEDRKDPAAAEELSQRFLQNRGLMAQDKKGEFKKKLESIVARAQFQQVRKVEESKDFGSAAAGYEKLAAESKDTEVRNKALNNAAVSYGKSGDKDNELRVYKKILESEPGNEQAEKAILSIGNEHFLSGRYDDAAGIFEMYFGLYENRLGSVKPASQKQALESIRSAALLRRALRQTDKAAEDFRRIVEASNKGIGIAKDAAGEFLFEGAKRFKEEGNSPEAIRGFQKYTSAFPDGPHAIGATMETAILYEQLREDEKSQNYLRTVISKVKARGGKASGEEQGYAAQARLTLLGPLEEAFENSKLRNSEAQLKADINAKLQALERLNKGYIEVMDFGDGTWGVEAFRRMAMAYRTFGRALENAPIPESYSPEDKAKFRAQTKNAAAPVYVKMKETLETALSKGEQLQVVGPVMARAYILSVLNSAKPDRLPLVQTVNWEKPAEWLMGNVPASEGELEATRKAMRAKQDDPANWVAIGNRHLLRGETDLAEIFYLQAAQKNAKYVPAINNLAFLKGKEGDFRKAMAGFKTALALDEFAVVPKKNMARLQMSSGLWRHASQNYRQLEVRQPNDREVKRGLSLANLAMGKLSAVDAGLLAGTDGSDNNRFAEAIYLLAKGDRAAAAQKLDALSGSNEYAKLITDFWNTKESE
jgi:cellulose synthase operon protein C